MPDRKVVAILVEFVAATLGFRDFWLQDEQHAQHMLAQPVESTWSKLGHYCC